MEETPLSEVDWRAEHALVCGGAISLRVWPAQSQGKVQAQWAAVDLWVAMREASTMATAAEKQKSSH